MQPSGGEGSGYYGLVGMLQHHEEPVEIADAAGRIIITITAITHDGGGLRGELQQHLGNLDYAHQIASLGRTRFERFGIEHLHATGAGIEMHVVPAIVNGFLSLTVVEIE